MVAFRIEQDQLAVPPVAALVRVRGMVVLEPPRSVRHRLSAADSANSVPAPVTPLLPEARSLRTRMPMEAASEPNARKGVEDECPCNTIDDVLVWDVSFYPEREMRNRGSPRAQLTRRGVVRRRIRYFRRGLADGRVGHACRILLDDRAA